MLETVTSIASSTRRLTRCVAVSDDDRLPFRSHFVDRAERRRSPFRLSYRTPPFASPFRILVVVPHSALETRPFTVTRVDSLEAFDSFAHEWDTLLRSSEVNGFFLSRAWVRAWYVACAEEFEMFVLAVRDGAQRLVGIAPLALRRDSSELQFAGQSFWGEYLGFILDPRFDRTAADLICRALAETFRASWSSIRLRFVHADSRFEQVLIEHADIYGLYLRETSLEGAPFAALPSDIDAYFETRSSHFAKRVDYLERRLAKTGEVELRLAGENLDVAEGIEEFWRLYNLRWDSFDPAFVAFHRQFAHELVARGEAWLAVLYVAGVAVAARYDFVYAGKVWSYLGGWDREWARFEVGNVLIGRLSDITDSGARNDIGVTANDPNRGRAGSESRRRHRDAADQRQGGRG